MKTKLSPAGDEMKKIRNILDNKQSGVSHTARWTHKSTLPRATHAICDLLVLMDPQARTEDVDALLSLLIADITDAFWQIPLDPIERRCSVAKHRKRWRVFSAHHTR